MRIKNVLSTKRGMTLVEVMVTTATIVLIIGVALYAFIVIATGWQVQHARTGLNIRLDRAMEEMTREIRQATEVALVQDDELRYTKDGSSYYIYYLYSPDDGYPPSFGASSYQLRKAQLSGGLYGTFTYGDGLIITGDVAPPAASDMSMSGNMVSVDLTLSRSDEVVRSRTVIRPRNI